jgi:hypothetical protein
MFASALPRADGSAFTATPSADRMPVPTGLPDPVLSRLASPNVTLTAPDFVNFHGSPLLVVQASADGSNNALDPTVHIDADLKHDGSFTDAGDADFATGQLGPNHTASITLTQPLAYGTYALRARVADAGGNVGVSTDAIMVVDPSAGFVGSEPLLDLAYGLPYGTPVPPPGLGNGGGENGGGGGAPKTGTPKPQDFKFLEFDQQGRVLVNVHSTLTKYLDGLQSDLQTKLGFATVGAYPSQNLVVGWLPVNQILNLSNLDHFHSVTSVYKPQVHNAPKLNIGSVTTEGDKVIKADTFRAANKVDGTGVKVGVLSDTVSQFKGGLADSVATGDLPPNVQVLQDGPAGGTDEGRAMLEIIHDVAPGAALAFHTAVLGPQNFADGIKALAAAGAKSITDDIGYADEPTYNDGVIAQSAENVVAGGAFYTTAAGNSANEAYQASYKGITATVGGVTGQFQDITGTGSALQTFTLAPNTATTIAFTWDAAFLEAGSPGNGTGNFKVNNNFIAQVTDAAGNALSTPQVFDATATNTNEAFDFITFTNDGSFGTNNFAFSFNLASGAAPTIVSWQHFGNADPKALNEGAPTIFGHPAAKGVVSTGAVDQANPTVAESFSALGGNISILFDANGVRLATPEVRAEPIVAGPDGVLTSFFPPPADSQGNFRFFGTSAATPHVAAAAALLMQQAPAATATQVTQYLVKNALNLNDPTHTGAGLIQLTVPLAVPTPTPTPTPPGIVTPFNAEEEINQTSDTALYLGTLFPGQPANLSNLDISLLADGRNDYDWFSFTAGQTGNFVANEGTTSGGNIELHLFTLQHGTLMELANSVTQSISSQSLSVAVAAGQEILVEVKGQNTSFGVQDAATYQLSAAIS